MNVRLCTSTVTFGACARRLASPAGAGDGSGIAPGAGMDPSVGGAFIITSPAFVYSGCAATDAQHAPTLTSTATPTAPPNSQRLLEGVIG